MTSVLSKPLMGSVIAIQLIMSLAFSAFPVIMPLLAISTFGLNSYDMSFFFVYIGLVQIVFQGFIVGRLVKKFGEEKMIALGTMLMMSGVFFMALFPHLWIFII